MPSTDARFTFDKPEGAKALLVLGGWHGARDKNVKKYTDEFNSWGVATLRTIMPGKLTFTPSNAGRAAFTRDLLAATRSLRKVHGLADKPLYFMFMSNGGCWIWASMNIEGYLDAEFADLGRDLSGVIFDSSPAFMTVATGAKVVSFGMNLPLMLVTTAGFYVAAGILLLYSLLTTCSLKATPPKIFWRTVREAKGRSRELYMFSNTDPLANADKIADLIAERTANGVETDFVRFKESRHCAHLRDQRDRYVEALRKFVNPNMTPPDDNSLAGK